MMDWLVIFVVCIIVYFVLMFIRNKLSIGGYSDRHVLITGCDTGFGHLLALRLDEMGFHVYAGCLTEKGEDELRKKASEKMDAFHFDVTQESSLKNALKHVTYKLPIGRGLWGVVNNAGIPGPGFLAPLEWLTKEDYEKTMAVNLFGLIETTRVFLPLVRKEKGRILLTSSVAGIINSPAECSYSLSKHAVESYANTLRMSARMYGVSVHTIRPGPMFTPFMAAIESNLNKVWERLDPELRTLYGQDHYDKVIRIAKELNAKASRKPSQVVEAYIHALTASYPGTHYLVGREAKTVYRAISLMPSGLVDFIAASSGQSPKLAGVQLQK